MSNTRIIGRDREIAQLDLAIGPGRDGLRFAMLSGPSGLGKTTLSTVASERSADRGFRVAQIRGRAGSLSTPFAPFIEAMPEFESLLSVLAVDQSIDLEHAGIGLVNLLVELSLDNPLLLIFDDAQALDESSIALLPYISGISERCDVTMLFVEQTDAIGIPSSYRAFVDGLLSRRVVNHLELQPLSADAIRTIVALELDEQDEAVIPEEIMTRAQGNPWFAKELAEAWRRGITEIPTNIAAAATARLHALDTNGQDMVLAVALCPDGAHIGWLEMLSGQRPRDFVRTMEAIEHSGLLREDGDVLTIAHPLMQQALVDDMSSAMRRALHVELADVIAQVPLSEVVAARAQGLHLASAGRTDIAIEQYLRAATANEVSGQLHEAYVDLTRASELETRPAERISLLRSRAFVAQQLGQYDDAAASWSEVARAAATTKDDDTYAYALYQQYWTCNDGSSTERLQRVASLGPDRIGWSARAAGHLCRLEGDYEQAIVHDTRALELAHQLNDVSLQALTELSIASSEADLGRMKAAVGHYRRAIDLAIRERLHAWVIKAWGSLAETLADDLQTTASLEACADALRYVDDLGLDRDRPALLAWMARAYVRVGRLGEAQSTIVQAMELEAQYRSDQHSALITGVYAEVVNEVGDRSAADAAVMEAVQTAHSFGYESWIVEAEYERAKLLARNGKIADALAIAESLDSSEPVFRSTLACWSARIAASEGDVRAAALATQLLQLAETDGGADAAAAALANDEARSTLTLIESGDELPLMAVADRWEAAERTLDMLRARTTVALALATRDKDRAVAILRDVRAGFSAIGAEYDADLIASRLRGLGTRSRAKSRETKVGPLTKRELEIARLVASGLKNSEVAGTLFLAEKTVAAHLSNIYGKVEVRSRVQLGAWIRENDPEFETALANVG